MSEHALLSASSSYRWLVCPPSAKLCAEHPDSSSPYAKQGTDCHELCAYLVEHELGRSVKNPIENLEYYDPEMQECAESYCSYVMEQIEEAKRFCPDPQVLIEQKLDFSRWVENGFGTGDCVIAADDTLQIIDYKHGVGVLVSAEKNPQMMLYALGALELFDGIYDISRIRMTIFQPRRENVSTFSMTKEELLLWAEEVLKPAAELAYEGKGEFGAGEHCRFCKIKAECRKRAEYNLEFAKYEFEVPPVLEDTEIAAILPKVDSLMAWAADIKEYALEQALRGKHFDGFKVVEGRANRKYKDEAAVVATVEDAGYEPYEKKVLGITAMTALLGKKKFEEILGELIFRPHGKPALVPESDKRPAVDTAFEDFKEN